MKFYEIKKYLNLLFGTLMYLDLTIFIFLYQQLCQFFVAGKNAKESKKSQRRSKQETVIIELGFEIGPIKAKKIRRHGNIFIRHENAETLNVPTSVARSLTLLCAGRYCISTISCDYNFPLFVTDVVRLNVGYAMSVGTFNGKFRFGIASNWTAISSLAIRSTCRNNN